MTTIDIPGSKSMTARALFLAAASSGVTRIERPLVSDDTAAFAECLNAMGFEVTSSDDSWTVAGFDRVAPRAEVFCRDAGTAARFLPALAAASSGVYRFDGSDQLRGRPMGALTRALQALGVRIEFEGADGALPFTIIADGIAGGDLQIDSSVSSQFLSALLMVAPLTRHGLRIRVLDVVSEPYVAMTRRMMEGFGVRVEVDGEWMVVPSQEYEPTTVAIEPDASSASYFFAAAALEGEVMVKGLGRTSVQGDLGFVDVLSDMGADVTMEEGSVTVRSTGVLRGIDVAMRDISDTMPTLAAIAPFASGSVTIRDVANTRVKESDRIAACEGNLRALGIAVETGPDWIRIHPGQPSAAMIRCHRDHRIAMAFSVAGLFASGLTLDDPECVKKTFPDFHRTLSLYSSAAR